MKRVGFIFPYTGAEAKAWVGGYNYMVNLIGAIYQQTDRRISAVLIVPVNTGDEFLRDFAGAEVLRSYWLDGRSKWKTALRRGLRMVFRRDVLIEWIAKRGGVDVISHSGHLGARAAIPSIGWIPDFQHVWLPHFFSDAERSERDLVYQRIAAHCHTVVLSSNHALGQYRRFALQGKEKGQVLRFVSGRKGSSVEVSDRSDAIKRKYGISEPYLFLPNQFWAHKNHGVVVEALNLMERRGGAPLVVCSGKLDDRRAPGYVEELLSRIKELGLENRFRTLGLIPYEDVLELASSAYAVINPSHFEGWSTSVEEAKSLGVRVVLSDIEVHREQAPSDAVFFDQRSAEDLARSLASLKPLPKSEADQRADAAQRDLEQRYREFGENYQQIVLSVLKRPLGVQS